MDNNQKALTISHRTLKEDFEVILTKLSEEPNNANIPITFSLLIANINQYSIPYAVMMLSDEFIQVIIQIYFEETFNLEINKLLTQLLEVFNFEMFSESPTLSLISQLQDLQINIVLSPPRKEVNQIEKLYDTMRSLEIQWKMIKEMEKEDNSIEANNFLNLIEALNYCKLLLKELSSSTSLAVIEYFTEYYNLLCLFTSNPDTCKQKLTNINEDIIAISKIGEIKQPINKSNNEMNNGNNDLIIKKENEVKMQLHQRTLFYINEKLKEEESIDLEFKNYYYPIPNHLFDEIKKQICGFLNSKGGRLYLGIGDNQVVKGLVLDYKSKDIIRNQLINCTCDFFPKCRTNKIKVLFIPIKTAKEVYIKNLYVIKIIVKQGDQGKLYSLSSKIYNSYLRMPGQCVCLSASEIYEEIIKRHNEAININNINDEMIDETLYDDPEPEIPVNDLNTNHSIIEGKPFNSTYYHKKPTKKMVTVKIDNINKICTEKELEEILKLTQYCSKKVFANEKGLCQGWAFVNYKTEKEAVYAIDLLKNVELKGKKLELQLRK